MTDFPFAVEPLVLTDGAITLSIPTEADIPAITAACQDPAIQEFTTVPTPYTEDDARTFVVDVAPTNWKRGGAEWAIRRADDEALVGMIGLMVPQTGSRPTWAEIGYWVAPEARGTGVLARAIPLVLDHAFDTLGMNRVQWTAAEGNWASWRAVWRHGFQREGTRRNGYVDNRTPDAPLRDLWVASLLPDDPRSPATPWDGPTTTPAGTPAPAIPSSRDPEALVRQFHSVYRMPVRAGAPTVDFERLRMRVGLIAEEFAELMGAIYGEAAEDRILTAVDEAIDGDDGTRDVVETADALADMIYVIYGMALEAGIDLPAVLNEVQRSNMSKLGADGEPIYREDGKVLKGPGFFNPDIARVLEENPGRA